MSGASTPETADDAGGQAPGGRHGRAADISTAGRDSAVGGREDAPKDAERATWMNPHPEREAVLAYARRLMANAERVMGNDAAGPDAREQALNWFTLLDWLISTLRFGESDPETLLRHWERLLGRMNDEIRAGLHRPDADGE